jgi:hypothetical protein
MNDLLRYGIVRCLGSKTHSPRYLTKDGFWTTDRNICGRFTYDKLNEYHLADDGTDEVAIYLNFNEIHNGKI